LFLYFQLLFSSQVTDDTVTKSLRTLNAN